MRDTIAAIHRDGQGNPDFAVGLTLDYQQEEDGQWAGVCLELGTPACADTLEQTKRELRGAVELQLNGMEDLGYLQEYLEARQAPILPLGPGEKEKTAAPGFDLAADR